MRKITFTIPVTITVNADFGISIEEIAAGLDVEVTNADPSVGFDVEDAIVGTELLTVTDSR